jgi:hypothetical protein
MRELVLGFNELSVVPTEIDTLHKGERCAVLLFECLKTVAKVRAAFAVVFAPGSLDKILCGEQARPLRALLRSTLGNDRFTWLIGHLRNAPMDAALDREVQIAGESGFGLLLAHLSESWSVSLLPTPPKWDQVEIDALKVCLEEVGILESQCTVRHVARPDHVAHWKNQLVEYGFEADGSNVIAKLGDLDVEMYPLDHGYPHIHLVDRRPDGTSRRPVTVAKYRIDKFERMEGGPRYDSELKEFTCRNREHLMRSWNACQRGEHPFQLEP